MIIRIFIFLLTIANCHRTDLTNIIEFEEGRQFGVLLYLEI